MWPKLERVCLRRARRMARLKSSPPNGLLSNYTSGIEHALMELTGLPLAHGIDWATIRKEDTV